MIILRPQLLKALAAVTCAAMLGPLSAQAAEGAYPDAPIRLIVPFSAGGGVDIVGRFLAKKLNEELKQSVIVENKPGASAMIGAAYVARSKPDGLTILLASSGETAINPHLYKDMAYDPAKDLAPVSLVAKIPNLLVVNPDIPVKTVTELVQYAKAHPDDMTYSSSGVGNIQNISGELFNKIAGTKIRHIPYKGSAQQIADVAARHVSMTFASGAALLPFVQSGQVRPIAVTSTTPMAAFPKVPPLAQTPEFKSYDLVNWFGLFAPAGTPKAIIDKLNAATVNILKDPAFVKTLELQGAIPAPMSPEEFAAFRASESEKFGKIIKDTGIVLDR
ncbi:Bug family tripartite tricarboxylate transporter substrate binding protein [Paralcaligenes ginsengisoli]